MHGTARRNGDWPQVIHRLWGEAQAERKSLVIDRSDGECFIISAGPVATHADAVEFVDEDGAITSLAYADIAAVCLTV